MKVLLQRCLYGFILGMAIGNVIAILTGSLSGEHGMISLTLTKRLGSETTALLVQTLLSGVYGAISIGGMCIYDIEGKRFGLTASALLHYLLVMLSYIPIALYLNWLVTWQDVLLMAVMMTIAYAIVFLIMYARYKAEVRELNKIKADSPWFTSGSIQEN